MPDGEVVAQRRPATTTRTGGQPRAGGLTPAQRPRGQGARVLAGSPGGRVAAGTPGVTQVAARGFTAAEVLADLHREAGSLPGIGDAAIVILDGRTAQVFAWPNRPLTARIRMIPGRITISYGGIGKPGDGGLLRPLMRRADGSLFFDQGAVLDSGTGKVENIGSAFGAEDIATIRRVVTGRSMVLHVFPSTPVGEEALVPPVPDEDVPEIFKPTAAVARAGMAAYPAELRPLTPLVTATDSTGSYLMHLDKTTGTVNTLDAVTNVMQPVTFRWEVLKLRPDDKAHDRLGALIDAYRRDAAAARTVGRHEGMVAGFERRARHAEEDRQVILGERPEEQGFVEQAVRTLSAEMLYEARLALGFVGQVALSVIRALLPGPGTPYVDDVIDIPFREEGLYLVRGLATPQPGRNARTTRATSVVGTFVEVRNLEALARNAMPTAQAQRDAFAAEVTAAETALAADRRLLEDPTLSSDRARWLRGRIAQGEARAAYLRARADAAGDPRATVRVERDEAARRLRELEALLAAATRPDGSVDLRVERAVTAQRAEVARLTGQFDRLDPARGDAWTTITPMDAVLVDDATGSPTDLLFTITTRRYVTRDPTVEIADVTAAEGRTASGSGPTVERAFEAALRDLRRNLGRGRGFLTWRAPSPFAGYTVDVPNPMRLQLGLADQLVETVDDAANVATIAALVAAPFTGGASLAVLAPLAAVGAATSAYRILDRAAYGNLSLDAAAVGDLLNIATLGVGRIGPAGQFATRGQVIFSQGGRIGARLLDAGGYAVMSYQSWKQFTAPNTSLDPRVDQERRLLAFLQFMQGNAVPVASHLWPAGHVPGAVPATRPPSTSDPQATPDPRVTPAPHPDTGTVRVSRTEEAPRLPVPAPELRAGLPPDVGVAVLRDPGLHGDTVRVHYTLDRFGLVAEVRVLAGPNADVNHVRLHAETARLMLRYQGVSGAVRVLIERVAGMFSPGKAPPRVGSRAWEAMLEVRKLPEIISYRARALALSGDPDVRAKAVADLEYLRAQLERHQSTVDRWDLEQGVGFVAAEGSHHDAAVAAGYPSLHGTPGHYYEPAPGGGYTLHQRAGSNDPAKRLVRVNNVWVLRHQTRATALTTALPPDLHQRLLATVTASEAEALHQLLGDGYLRDQVTNRTASDLQARAAVAVELRNLAGDPTAAEAMRRLRASGGSREERNPATIADILSRVTPDRLSAYLTVVAHPDFQVYQTRWLSAVAESPELLRFLERADGMARFTDLRRHTLVIEEFLLLIRGQSDAQVVALADRIQAAGRGEASRSKALGIGPPPPPPPLPADLQLAPAAIDAKLAEARRWVDEHAKAADNLASENPFQGTDPEVRAYAEALARIADVTKRVGDYQARTHAERLDVLERFERLLRQPGFTFKTTWINNLRGSLSERLFIPAARQLGRVRIPHPAGGHTIPDYSLTPADPAPLAPPGATPYTRWVEQKSDLITAPGGRTDVYAPAVARARRYAADAALDYQALSADPGRANDMIFIEFVRSPGNRATETAMLRELFAGTPPIRAARFADGPWIERTQWLAANP